MDLLTRGLKLSHLRLIAALPDTGLISLAAEQIGITQPAASRLLSEIEQIVGRPVHRRVGRGAELTHEGAALARRARRALLELSTAGQELEEFGKGAVGTVRIGAIAGPALDIVLPIVQQLSVDAPDLAISLDVGHSADLPKALAAGTLDIALCRLLEPNDELELQPLGKEEATLVVRQGHPALSDPSNLGKLLGYDWVLPQDLSPLRLSIDRGLRAMGYEPPRARLITASFAVTMARLVQSDAVAPLARAFADKFAGPGMPLAILPSPFSIEMAPYGLVTRRGVVLTPAADRVRNLIAAQAIGTNNSAA